MKVDVRVEAMRTARVDLFGELSRDVRIPQVFPHHRAILGFRPRVVVGMPGAALGWGPAPKVVEMGHRNARQSLEARIPEQLAGPDTVPCRASMSASKATSVAVKDGESRAGVGQAESTAYPPGGSATPVGLPVDVTAP